MNASILIFLAIFVASIEAQFTTVGQTGTSGTVNTIVAVGSTLYVGGDFTSADQTPANNLVMFSTTTSTWTAVGGGTTDEVTGLSSYPDGIAVVGDFTSVNSTIVVNGGAVFNSSGWFKIPRYFALSSPVAVVVNATTIYVADSGNVLSYPGAQPNGTSGIVVADTDDVVQAIYFTNGLLYIGGEFTVCNGTTASSIVSWNGVTWAALGAGISGGSVWAMTSYGSNLYVGGDFDLAGGYGSGPFAKWTGTTWVQYQICPDETIYALAADSAGNIYAGGDFVDLVNAGGCGGLAKLSSSTNQWNCLTQAPIDFIYSLTFVGSSLYLGGQFTLSGPSGSTIQNVALYTGPTTSEGTTLLYPSIALFLALLSLFC